jgi:hypothetical protein
LTSYADRVKKVMVLPDGCLEDPRDELYCRIYANSFSRPEAFKAIGLNPGKRGNWKDTGRDYIYYRPHINERIKVLVSERVQDLCIDENWVVLKLVSNLEKAMQDEEVLGPDGESIGEYKFDGRTATKVLEMLGTQLGMFERNKAPERGGVTIHMNFGGDAPDVRIEDGRTIDVEPG